MDEKKEVFDEMVRDVLDVAFVVSSIIKDLSEDAHKKDFDGDRMATAREVHKKIDMFSKDMETYIERLEVEKPKKKEPSLADLFGDKEKARQK